MVLSADQKDAAYARARAAWANAAMLAFALWAAVELWSVTLNLLSGSAAPSMISAQAAGTLIATLLSLACYGALRATQDRSWPVRAGVVAGTIIFSAMTYAVALRLISLVTPMAFRRETFDAAQFLWESLYWLTPFALWTLLASVMENARVARVREARLSQALIAAREAEIRVLRYQINPHFLYNALNSISTLILDGRNAEAERMVMSLSGFFRASLTSDPLRDTSLSHEVAQQRLYLELEQIRFVDLLRVAIDIPEELASARVPSLILQPLVENAIKHGRHGPGRETLIELRAWAEGPHLILQVTDNGPGEGGGPGTGVGLENVRGRLSVRFGEQARLEAASRPEGGFVATITMPLERGAA